jgi:pimeloyl-ACP methyl ester carboxylesterase
MLAALVGIWWARGERPPVAGGWFRDSGLELASVMIDEHAVRYVRTGSGSAVLLVHGFGSSVYTWRDAIPVLAEDYEIIGLDLPGFGSSDRPPSLSFRELVNATSGLLDRLGVGQVSVVGNSLGGGVAAALAALEPERVQRLVLIDSIGFQHGVEDAPLLLRLVTSPTWGPIFARLPLKRASARLALRQVFHDDAFVTDERVEEYAAPWFRPGTAPAVRSLFRADPQQWLWLRDSIQSIRVPTLVIWGAEDTWIPVEHARLFEAAIPDSHVEILDACGHMPQEECSGRVSTLLRAFLALADTTTAAIAATPASPPQSVPRAPET